jgi:hypothetical protein
MYIFQQLCGPAKFYACIAFLTLLYSIVIQTKWLIFFITAALFIAWVFSLDKMCTSGYVSIAWLMAIIPHFIFLICTVKVGVKTTNH